MLRSESRISDFYIRGRWLIAKHRSVCKCGIEINIGDDLWYVPHKKESSCYQCEFKNYPEELRSLLS